MVVLANKISRRKEMLYSTHTYGGTSLMTSLIKVDSIQTAAGGTPTASSLGIGGVGKHWTNVFLIQKQNLVTSCILRIY